MVGGIYIKSFSELINTNIEEGIYPTTINLLNEDGESSIHSIVIVYLNNTYYFFDPNGSYNNNDRWKYFIDNIKFDSTKIFKKHMSKNYKMNFVVPTQKGIQQITFSPDKSYYIGDGGYCMFYNAIFIQTISNFIKLNKGLERTEFIEKFNDLYGRLTGNYNFKDKWGIPLYPVNVESGDNVDISKSLQRYILEIIIKFIPYYNHIIYNQVIDILKSNNKGMLKAYIKKNLPLSKMQ